MQINEIIIGHAGNVVHHDLVGLSPAVAHLPGIPGLVYIIHMMEQDGRILLVLDQIVQHLLVDLLHHGLDHPVQDRPSRLGSIDHGVVFLFVGLHRLEMLLVQLDVGLAVAVFNDVDHQIVDDLRINASDHGIGELAVVHHLDAGCVLTILSQIGNDVGNTHHIALQGVGLDLVGIAGDGVGLFQLCLKVLKTVHGHGMIFRKLDLAVVTGDTGQGLQSQIQGEDLVQHPGRMNVVVEKPARMTVIQLIQIHLAAVGKGGMTDVMSESDSLNEIQVQIQRPANGTGDPGHQLHMQTPSGDVVVSGQRKHLGLVGVTVIVGAVQNAVNVLCKPGSPDAARLVAAVTAMRHAVSAGLICIGAVSFFPLHASRQFL